ncbi:MAG: hypothetical protein ACD_2C00093G0003 [uncultured bacterium (gcode 4)]|uniref:Uncharacterized protein n=1 Tax=uncultured bacterium (gcode 4) TaxID=1234023 RepID=K2FF14_9BACT|nr:MAG: hypothetical protein ACD_2C00093G0003 [uncultured bacterium (gcode 4)]
MFNANSDWASNKSSIPADKNIAERWIDFLVNAYRKLVNAICKPKNNLAPEKTLIDMLINELESNLTWLRWAIMKWGIEKSVKDDMLEKLDLWLMTRWKLKSNLVINKCERREKDIRKAREWARLDYIWAIGENSGNDIRNDEQLKTAADYLCWSLIWVIHNENNTFQERLKAMRKLEAIRWNEYFYLELVRFEALVKKLKSAKV